MRTKRQTPVYTMAVTARLCEMPAYTIRWLEDNAMVRPSRSRGNQRVFSEDDIDLLREIAALLAEGVNLAGIRAVFRIKKNMEAP